jgi:nucleotide-binding universal stress UspA family protein
MGTGMVTVDLKALAAEQAEEVERTLAGTAAGLRSQGIDVETHRCSGDPARMIVETAITTNADLIVVGNKGMSGAKRFLLGSVPNKVAHSSPCDVLIVYTS